MLTSLAFIFLFGLMASSLCEKLKLPKIIGMLFIGILLGPFALNVLDSSILGISSELRRLALIIILLKAGLSIDIRDLKKVGRPAILLSFLPATFEIGAFAIFAPKLLNISLTDALIMGAVLGAVSPAVVVPRMVGLIEKGYGTNKSIPQMILAGASLDDVYVIVLFSTFLTMGQGKGFTAANFISIPISIISGILFGMITGLSLSKFFENKYKTHKYIRNSTKVIIVLGFAFILSAMENWLHGFLPMSGLLAVMSMAMGIKSKSVEPVTKRLSEKFGKLWLAAEIVLFVLVGAAVDIGYSLNAGAEVIIMIFLALAIRILGTCICLIGTNLNKKERLYCMLSYLPKATVQAAIGSVPLSMGLPCGKLVLTVAVVAIIVTAPLGAFFMDSTYKKLLSKS